jgi:hypothetical protein
VPEIACEGEDGMGAIVVRETTMHWIRRFRTSEKPAAAHLRNETLIDGAANDRPKDLRSSPESPVASGNRPDAQRAEEIKRRQISLAVRCVWMMRAR